MKKVLLSSVVLVLMAGPLSGAAGAKTTQPTNVIDRELAVFQLDPSGKVLRSTLLDSLTIFGRGNITLTDLGSSSSVRNLYGFDRPSTSGEKITWNVDVDGSKEILTSSQISRRGPLTVTPSYFLNGKKISPSQLKGRSGRVTIEYQLVNSTARTETLEHVDASGETVRTPLTTYVPLVGQVQFIMPADRWSNLTARGGQVTTDEKNNHNVTFSSVLAPIVGQTQQTIRVSGNVKRFTMEETRITFLPVVPAGVSSRAGSTFTATNKLFNGVGEIDSNLIKLRDGTAQLSSGLQQLYEGILEARAGVGEVGTDGTIVDGLSKVLAGLEQLGGSQGLPAAAAGVDGLIAGVRQLIAGLGSSATPNTVLGGLAGLDAGLAGLRGASGLAAIKGGIDQTNLGVGAFARSIGSDPTTAAVAPDPLAPSSTTLSNDLQYMKENFCGTSVACHTAAAVAQGKLDTINACLTTGGASVCSGAEPNGVSEALSALSAGTQQAITSIGDPTTSASTTLRGGLAAVTAGVQQVRQGLTSGSANNPKVLEGLQAVAGGLTRALAGIGAAGSADTLTDGVDRLLEGSQELGSGLDQIAAGASTAQDGSTTIGDGQQALSQQGTRVMQTSVGSSVEEASKAIAVLGAMRTRAAEGAMLYGAPEGASGNTTFVYKVAEISQRYSSTLIKMLLGVLMAAVLMAAARRGTWAKTGTPAGAGA